MIVGIYSDGAVSQRQARLHRGVWQASVRQRANSGSQAVFVTPKAGALRGQAPRGVSWLGIPTRFFGECPWHHPLFAVK